MFYYKSIIWIYKYILPCILMIYLKIGNKYVKKWQNEGPRLLIHELNLVLYKYYVNSLSICSAHNIVLIRS